MTRAVTLARAALLATSAAIELFVCGSVRYGLAWAAAWVALSVAGAHASTLAPWAGAAAAWGPLLGTALALAGAPGGDLRRWRLGARRPSAREQDRIDKALAMVDAPGDPRPRTYVVDHPTPDAFVLGSALYLHRALIDDPGLGPVLAHELGHLTAGDGRVALALCRLAPLGAGRLRTALVGGLSLVLLRPAWEAWLRAREHAADRYAVDRGQALDLASFLDSRQLADLSLPYLSGLTHPYVEERVDRLLELGERRERAMRERAPAEPVSSA